MQASQDKPLAPKVFVFSSRKFKIKKKKKKKKKFGYDMFVSREFAQSATSIILTVFEVRSESWCRVLFYPLYFVAVQI